MILFTQEDTMEDNKFDSLEVVSYYMKAFDESFKMSRHYHPYIEITYCYEGTVILEVLDKSSKEVSFKKFTIEKDSFYIINSYLIHKMYTPAPCFVYNLEFTNKSKNNEHGINVDSIVSTNLSELIKSNKHIYNELNKSGYIILRDIQTVGHQMRTLISSLSKGINDINDAITLKARMILLFNDAVKCTNEVKSDRSIVYVKKTKDYIAQHYCDKIVIDEIANSIGINKFYLQRFFKSMTGSTILKYVNDYRLAKSKELLTSTTLSIEEIVRKSGFRNRQHLIYEFKNRFNITPSEYRKEYLNPVVESTSKNYVSGDYDKEQKIIN